MEIEMKKKLLILISMMLLAVTLTLTLSGCGGAENELEGKNIAVFELNGGTLEFKTSSVSTKINFAYHPGTYILDPAEIPGYKIYRNDFVFTGWYTSPECKPEEKWDFEANTFDTESLTLYAGWAKAIKYTFTVMYVDGEETVTLGTPYEVSEGDRFDDWRKYANDREGYTPMGYFSDPELTVPWDASTTHPGGDEDTDVPVYVSYIEGEWALTGDLATLERAVSSGKNVYLTNDIDCGGAELSLGSYGGIFEGNGYKVGNFTVKKSGGVIMPVCSIFDELSKGAEIRNVTFDEVRYELFEISDIVRAVKVSALAKTASGAKVENVTVKGTLATDYDGELPKLLEPFYEDESEAEIGGFTAEITVEKQAQ